MNGKVTWLNGGNTSDYGPMGEYVIETSSDLVTWTPVDIGELTANDPGDPCPPVVPGNLTYTLDTAAAAGKEFARLKVMAP